jgi:Flp pilus assembly protein TadB
VLQDIIRDVQEIVRSEMRLAKTELREEAAKAKTAAGLLAAAAVTALFAVFFVLLTVVDALALVMPRWAAALIVGVGLAVIATVMVMAGLTRLKQIQATPARAMDSMKENVEWVKQQTK